MRMNFCGVTMRCLKLMGGWVKSKPEATRIIVGTIPYNPGQCVAECIKQTFRQFVRMKPGDGNTPYLPFVIEDLRMFYPEDIHMTSGTTNWL